MFISIASLSSAVTAAAAALALTASPAAGQSAAVPWTVSLRAISNPLPVGQCTSFEIVVTDPSGATPLRPNGRPLDWQDFELSFSAASPDALAWSNETPRSLCALAATAPSAVVVAGYPGAHVPPQERVPGMVLRQFVELAIQSPAAADGYAAAAGGYPQPPAAAGGYAPPPGGAAPTGGYQPAVEAAAGAPGQPYLPPLPSAGAVPPGPAGAQQPYQPPQPVPADPYGAQAATAGAAQNYPPPAAAPVTPAPPAAAAAPPPAQTAEPPVKDIGGLFKRIGKQVKKKAVEVKDQTMENVASGATQIVDATAETGSALVSRTTAEASSAARGVVGGVGQSLTPTALRGGVSADNLASALASGYAVLRMLRFTGNTDVLEPSGRQLAERLAEALKAIPDTFVIEAHVDPLLSPTATQELSEHRAAAVKSALVGHGVPGARLCALGYGASVPMAEIPPGGGPPSSARVELQSFARVRSYFAGRLELCRHQPR